MPSIDFDYQLVRSRRKTLGIHIKRGQVTVRAPLALSKKDIDAFLTQKSAWLQAKLSQQQALLNEMPTPFRDGSDFWLFGERKKLQVQFQAKNAIALNDDILTVCLRRNLQTLSGEALDAAVKKQLAVWLKIQAQQYLPQRVNQLSVQLALRPSAINIRLYKARWGSCNSRGELSFNYLLLMLPHWVIDYVIIHELCHLQHLNHSAHFWSLVASHCRFYAEAKRWLRQHQHQLGWH